SAPQSGYFQKFDEKMLLEFCVSNNVQMEFLHARGSYFLKGTPLLKITGSLDENKKKRLMGNIDFYYGQIIQENAYYGFFHLSEVAVKALSPGANDPCTAVLSVHALSDLSATFPVLLVTNSIVSRDGVLRVSSHDSSCCGLFDSVILPLFGYASND